jgi:Na+-driven multidrug efflux pump
VLAQVMGITNPIVISVAGLVVPAVAAAAASDKRARDGIHAARRVAFIYGLQGAALLLPYYAFVVLLPLVALRIFSKNNPAYFGLTTHLRLFVLTYAIIFPAQVMTAFFNGLGRSRNAFIAQCAFSAATLGLSLPLAVKFGLTGAVWSGALPALIYVITSAIMLRSATAEPRGFEVRSIKHSREPAPLSAAAPEGAAA